MPIVVNIEESFQTKKKAKYQWLHHGSIKVLFTIDWHKINGIGNPSNSSISWCSTASIQMRYAGNYAHINRETIRVRFSCGENERFLKRAEINQEYKIGYFYQEDDVKDANFLIKITMTTNVGPKRQIERKENDKIDLWENRVSMNGINGHHQQIAIPPKIKTEQLMDELKPKILGFEWNKGSLSLVLGLKNLGLIKVALDSDSNDCSKEDKFISIKSFLSKEGKSNDQKNKC